MFGESLKSAVGSESIALERSIRLWVSQKYRHAALISDPPDSFLIAHITTEIHLAKDETNGDLNHKAPVKRTNEFGSAISTSEGTEKEQVRMSRAINSQQNFSRTYRVFSDEFCYSGTDKFSSFFSSVNFIVLNWSGCKC